MDLMGSVTVIRWGKQRAHTEEEQHNGCAVDQVCYMKSFGKQSKIEGRILNCFRFGSIYQKRKKMDKPAILYVGKDTDHSWLEEETEGGEVRVRDVGATLNKAINSDSNVKSRPTINIQHATFQPGAKWKVHVPHKQSALLYVRRGIAAFPNTLSTITALQTATFAADGDFIDVWNVSKQNDLDVLLLTGDPLQESIAMGGPIVMNTSKEIQDAYQQLSEGNFLDRDTVLQQHALNRPK
mmetsp:Transcript_19263/g.24530  ORF Transcript_19263/g.24530 Transcript_19263/m.24530 type:complete len:239 (+) Transcript_19263:214-930(+)